MQNPREDWRHAYIGALLREQKTAQQHRDGVRWAVMTGLITGVVVGAALLLFGVY